MLGDPQTRLVTVTGPGGVEDAPALAASAVVAPDPAVRVDLAPLDDARLVAEAIAAAAGAGSSPGASALDAAVAALGDERTLLVLDNFEHVALAAADLGAPCCDACPGVTALVTSRHALGLSGGAHAARWRRSRTPAADGDDDAASAAVALFVARPGRGTRVSS